MTAVAACLGAADYISANGRTGLWVGRQPRTGSGEAVDPVWVSSATKTDADITVEGAVGDKMCCDKMSS